MDERVDEDEHPDWRRHVSDASPHAEHSASMVVGLQCWTSLSLGQNDQGVQDLIKLGKVEEPAPKGQTLTPKSSYVGGIRCSILRKMNEAVLCLPDIECSVVSDRITQTPGALNLA